MRRQDTQSIGKQAETLAASLLIQRGFSVRNLNEERPNNPLYDLNATKNGNEILVSVKCARAKRQLRVGSPQMLTKMRDDCVVMAFLPAEQDKEFSFVLVAMSSLSFLGRSRAMRRLRRIITISRRTLAA